MSTIPARKPFSIKLRPAERELVERAAALAQERPATWAREALVAAAILRIAKETPTPEEAP